MLRELLIKNAKRKFNKNLTIRKRMFEKYHLLLSNGLSYRDISIRLKARIDKKNKGKEKITPQLIFLEHVIDILNEGGKFSDALKGWASDNEVLIIASGEEANNDLNSIEQCISLMGNLITIKKTVIKSSIYPIVLLTALVVVIYLFNYHMIPILKQLAPIESWDNSAQNLAAFTDFFSRNIVFILAFIGVFLHIVFKSLPKMTGDFRNRILDKYIPPYSIYKEIQSGLFLVSLSTLLKSGTSFKKSLDFILKGSGTYMQQHVGEILNNIDNGIAEGEAINTDFIGDIGDDIEDFAAGSDLPDTLSKLGGTIVEDKLEGIIVVSAYLKVFSMAAVFSFILIAVSAFFSVTQSLI